MRIHAAGEHLLSLINDVLDISSLEQGQLRIDLQPVPLGEVLQEALPLVESLAGMHGVTLHADTSNGIAYGDRTRIRSRRLSRLDLDELADRLAVLEVRPRPGAELLDPLLPTPEHRFHCRGGWRRGQVELPEALRRLLAGAEPLRRRGAGLIAGGRRLCPIYRSRGKKSAPDGR